jgi:DNA-binding LacI/PurR family transcriptional regulator
MPLTSLGEKGIRRLLTEIEGGRSEDESALPTEFVGRESIAKAA